MKRTHIWMFAGMVLLFSACCLRAQESAPATIIGSGKPNFIPIWTNTTTLSSSTLFEKSGRVGVGTQTPAATLEVNGAAKFDQAVTFASGQTFPGAASLGANTFTNTQTISNGDMSISNGNLDLPGTTGATMGVIKLGGYPFIHECCFSSVLNSYTNTFVGPEAGNFTSTGTYNTASGTLTLFLNTTGSNNTAAGFNALFHNNTGGYNTATGAYALDENTTGGQNTASGSQALGANTTGGFNTASGNQALYLNISGSDNTASGNGSLYSNTTGGFSTADGNQALDSNTTGGENTASGASALYYNTTGGFNTAVGYQAGANPNFAPITAGSENTFVGAATTATVDGLTNATAIGYYATVGESNALVLGASGTRVGIGTATPSNILTVAQGAGPAIADGWNTYSSRRWKSNIRPLEGALGKVERLQGVSYTYSANGKHDIGMIAEEVGKVIPEVVSYEANGKDAQGIDYSRLTALLVEAVKQQQSEIRQQQLEINRLKSEVSAFAETK